MSKPDWNNSCIWYNDTNRQMDIEGAAVAARTYAINVQWYTQKIIGTLEYQIENGDDAKPLVQSNSTLLWTGIDDNMHQVLGTRVRVPRRRTTRSNQMDDFEYTTRQSLQTTEGNWCRREYGNLWIMDEKVSDLAIGRIGLWYSNS